MTVFLYRVNENRCSLKKPQTNKETKKDKTKPPKTKPKYPRPFPPCSPLQKAQMDNQQITDMTDKQG